MSPRRPGAGTAVGAARDPLDQLDPSARALVLDILGIFVADALAATPDVNVEEPARRTPPAVPAQRHRTSRGAQADVAARHGP